MFNKLKSQKGITGIDLTISIIIIMIFVSIISAVSINLSTTLSSKKRLNIATNCLTEIMEKLDEINYENVEETTGEVEILKSNYLETQNPSKFDNEIVKILNGSETYNILTVSAKVEKYVSEIDRESTEDLVKKVTIKITYKLNNQDEVIEVSRLKTKYNVN